MGVYDPRLCIVSFNGVPLSGFAKGTFIKATKRKPTVTLEELGPDGEGAFVVSGDLSYDIEITLQKSSPSNTLLSQWEQATAKGAPIVGSFAVEMLNTGSVFVGKETMVSVAPPFEAMGGDSMGTNVWKFVAKRGDEQQKGFSV